MPAIERLPPSVVNKIAAGEVIERPASVVKELLENALDAGAGRIEVTVEKGGLDLLRVSDDGCGIPAHELPLAVAAHATSKIRTAEDLFRVGTLGFRGEALASIAEVSRLLLRSRQRDAAGGAQIEIIGGRPTNGESPVAPCGCPLGTTVEVRNLFFNTPVRRKFLKSIPTELGHVSEIIARLSLAHPQVHFTFKHNGRVVQDLPPAAEWRDRIARWHGEDLARELLWIERCDAGDAQAGVRLYGYVASPAKSRPNNKSQYLFLNGRYVRDRALSHALSEGYRGLLLTGRFPVCFLCFETPPDAVDVNVHPTKLEVRFQDGGRLYSLLLGTLRTRFLSTDLTARWQAGDAPATPPEADDPTAALDDRRADDVRRELVAWAKGKVEAWEEKDDASAEEEERKERTEMRFAQSDFSFPTARHAPLALTRLTRFEAASRAREAQPPAPHADHARTSDDAPFTGGPSTGRVSGKAMQIHSRYLVAESDEGMVVIDQHALHERILYEQLRERVLGGALESQNLLVPETIDLAPADAAAVLEQQELLGRLGIAVQAFGGDTVLVSSYPAMLASVNVEELFQGVVEQLAAQGRAPQRRDLLDELLHMMSCKAAIKAGDRLTSGEIEALLEQRHLAQDAHHCPHGRPTALVLTRAELDRQFLRT